MVHYIDVKRTMDTWLAYDEDSDELLIELNIMVEEMRQDSPD